MAADARIIGFYSGEEPDHRGRYLHEIQRWADDRLEAVHDYIQWLFPLPEPSGFNAAAPVLTRKLIEDFRTRPELQQSLRVSFLRVAEFYGLEVHLAQPVTVTRRPDFAVKAAGWLSPGNHNHLRITRILRCLNVLGLEAESRAFFECLSEIYRDEHSKPLPAISRNTFDYWRKAASDVASWT